MMETLHNAKCIIKDPEKNQDPAGIWTQDLLMYMYIC